MESKFRVLQRNIGFFTIGSLLPKALSFLMIPIYTLYLTPAELGVSDLLISAVMLALPIFTLNIQESALRFSMDKNEKSADVLTVCLRVTIKGGGLLALVLLAAALCGTDGIERGYLMFVFFYFMSTAAFNSLINFCKGMNLVRHTAIAGIISSVIMLCANICAIFFDLGLNGYLAANVLGYAAADLYLLFFARLYRWIRGSGVSRETAERMRKFCFPLIFSVLAWWVNTASDRYIITLLRGAAACGLYSAASKLPVIMTTLQGIFNQAWSISAIRDFDSGDSDGFISGLYSMFTMAMVCACSLLFLFNVPLARLLYADAFYTAWRYTPPLLLSAVFNALSLFVGSLFIAVKDTRAHSLCLIAGAVFNILGNFVLVSLFGPYGAALSTMISYLAVLLLSRAFLRKHLRMKSRNLRDTLAFLLLIGQMALASLYENAIPAQAAVAFILALLYSQEVRSLFVKIGRRGL